MKNFIRRDLLVKVLIGGIAISSLVLVCHKIDSNNKAQERRMEQMKEDIIKQNGDLQKDIKGLDNKIEKYKNQVDKLDKAVQEKQSFREKVSLAIQNTSDYVTRGKANELATIVDEVTSDFKRKYGFKKDVAKLLAIVSAESDFRNLEPNDAGAIGYAQITPPCLEGVNKRAKFGYTMDDMYNARKNLEVAWYYINMDKYKYGDEKAIVAYNQGYRNLTKAVEVSRGSSTSYLSKVTVRTLKYKEMIGI